MKTYSMWVGLSSPPTMVEDPEGKWVRKVDTEQQNDEIVRPRDAKFDLLEQVQRERDVLRITVARLRADNAKLVADVQKLADATQRVALGAVALVEVPKYRDADGRPACGVSPDEVCSMLAHGWCGHIRRFLRERTHKGTYAPPAICPVWKEVDRG